MAVSHFAKMDGDCIRIMLFDDPHYHVGILLYMLYLDQRIYPEMEADDYRRYDRASRALQNCLAFLSNHAVDKEDLVSVCAAGYYIAADNATDYAIRDATRTMGTHASDAFTAVPLETAKKLTLAEEISPISQTRSKTMKQHDIPQNEEYKKRGRPTGKKDKTQRAKRCPNGQHRVPAKTGDCVPKTGGSETMGGVSSKWTLFSRKSMLAISTISIHKWASKMRAISQKTVCEMLSGIYEANLTPVHVPPSAAKRGRPKKPPVLAPGTGMNTHATLTRNACLWVGMLLTAFPQLWSSQSTPKITSALLHLSGEFTATSAVIPLSKPSTSAVQYIQQTLPLWLSIKAPV